MPKTMQAAKRGSARIMICRERKQRIAGSNKHLPFTCFFPANQYPTRAAAEREVGGAGGGGGLKLYEPKMGYVAAKLTKPPGTNRQFFLSARFGWKSAELNP